MKYVRMMIGEIVYKSKGHQYSGDRGETWKLTGNEGLKLSKDNVDYLVYRRPLKSEEARKPAPNKQSTKLFTREQVVDALSGCRDLNAALQLFKQWGK
jgi:hypothetical protein